MTKEKITIGGYIVTDCGKIYSERRGIRKEIKPHLGKDGYFRVCLYAPRKHTYTLHRLVAIAFCENKELAPMVCHKNGIRNDNRAANLYWGDKASNYIDSVNHGTAAVLDRHGTSKLTVAQVKEIKGVGGQYSLKELAGRYCVHIETISAILRGKSWKTV